MKNSIIENFTFLCSESVDILNLDFPIAHFIIIFALCCSSNLSFRRKARRRKYSQPSLNEHCFILFCLIRIF